MTRIRLRRKLKLQFIKIHREFIEKVLDEKKKKHEMKQFSIKLTRNEKGLAEMLRREIGYNNRTNDRDIVHSLLIMAEKEFEFEKLEA